MPRRKRVCPAGLVFLCLNRAVARLAICELDADYTAFERVLAEAFARVPLRILAYALLPNLWHLVVWPRTDTEVTDFLQWVTVTHTMRWHAHYHSSGSGHLYQGRFQSFPVQSDEHLFSVFRYVERNPLRAGLVERAEDWQWGSAWRRRQRKATLKNHLGRLAAGAAAQLAGLCEPPANGGGSRRAAALRAAGHAVW
jgi:putative transposase